MISNVGFDFVQEKNATNRRSDNGVLQKQSSTELGSTCCSEQHFLSNQQSTKILYVMSIGLKVEKTLQGQKRDPLTDLFPRNDLETLQKVDLTNEIERRVSRHLVPSGTEIPSYKFWNRFACSKWLLQNPIRRKADKRFIRTQIKRKMLSIGTRTSSTRTNGIQNAGGQRAEEYDYNQYVWSCSFAPGHVFVKYDCPMCKNKSVYINVKDYEACGQSLDPNKNPAILLKDSTDEKGKESLKLFHSDHFQLPSHNKRSIMRAHHDEKHRDVQHFQAYNKYATETNKQTPPTGQYVQTDDMICRPTKDSPRNRPELSPSKHESVPSLGATGRTEPTPQNVEDEVVRPSSWTFITPHMWHQSLNMRCGQPENVLHQPPQSESLSKPSSAQVATSTIPRNTKVDSVYKKCPRPPPIDYPERQDENQDSTNFNEGSTDDAQPNHHSSLFPPQSPCVKGLMNPSSVVELKEDAPGAGSSMNACPDDAPLQHHKSKESDDDSPPHLKTRKRSRDGRPCDDEVVHTATRVCTSKKLFRGT